MKPLTHYRKLRRALKVRDARRMREVREYDQKIAREQTFDNDRLRYMTQAEINRRRR